jgi:CRISPR system Cascade subunit CasD
MNDKPNTIFLRLEGPLQAWGDNSKFLLLRTMEAPTKSGVIGLICCAMGLSRQVAAACPIDSADLHGLANRLIEDPMKRNVLRLLGTLAMGVRIDRPGTRWWDYHTVGAGYGILSAEGKVKKTATTGKYETLITRREYLCDASFLVALQGDPELMKKIFAALEKPKWPLFLGRKSCPPSVPLTKASNDETWSNPAEHETLREALGAVPWRPRLKDLDRRPAQDQVLGLIDCQSDENDPGEVWYDVPVSFDPPVHEARLVVRDTLSVKVGHSTQQHTPPPPRPRANYSSHKWTDVIRPQRLVSDEGLCVFCKQQATQVHHASYRHAGGDESVEHELRSLCRLCHDAVTMIEYGLGMGLDRIDPTDLKWRNFIIHKRDEIRRWRSEEGRRRALRSAPEKIRREVLEEEV